MNTIKNLLYRAGKSGTKRKRKRKRIRIRRAKSKRARISERNRRGNRRRYEKYILGGDDDGDDDDGSGMFTEASNAVQESNNSGISPKKSFIIDLEEGRSAIPHSETWYNYIPQWVKNMWVYEGEIYEDAEINSNPLPGVPQAWTRVRISRPSDSASKRARATYNAAIQMLERFGITGAIMRYLLYAAAVTYATYNSASFVKFASKYSPKHFKSLDGNKYLSMVLTFSLAAPGAGFIELLIRMITDKRRKTTDKRRKTKSKKLRNYYLI